jgi:hypothetical protein
MRAKWFCGLVAVSRFFCFPIQMNFAENKKWPTSAGWRARATDGVGGSTRGGQPKGSPDSWWPAARQPPASTALFCTISCRHPLSGPLNRLAGSGLASEGFIVGVDLHETGRSMLHGVLELRSGSRRHRLCTARWMGSVGDWPLATAVTQSDRGQPRAADAEMAEAAR